MARKYLLFGIIGFCLLLKQDAYGQAVGTCNSSLSEAPVIRGLYLGMSSSEAMRVLNTGSFPKPITITISLLKCPCYALVPLPEGKTLNDLTPEKRKPYDDYYASLRTVSIGQSVYEYKKDETIVLSPKKFEGYRGLKLSFLHNKLYEIDIDYGYEPLGDTIRWKDTREFSEVLSEKFNLSKKYWKPFQIGDVIFTSEVLYYTCKDFRIRASTFALFPRLTIEDSTVVERLNALAHKAYEESKNKKKRNFKP